MDEFGEFDDSGHDEYDGELGLALPMESLEGKNEIYLKYNVTFAYADMSDPALFSAWNWITDTDIDDYSFHESDEEKPEGHFIRESMPLFGLNYIEISPMVYYN